MTRHLFVDESKSRDYLLVATGHDSSEVEDLRLLMRGLVLRGQHRLHMTKESDSRRRAIAAAICGAGVRATVYNAGRTYPDELQARAACLAGLVADIADDNTVLVLERDDSLRDWDRRQLYALTRAADLPRLRYEHQRAAGEQLLGLPDAIAWCWAKGGDWRRRIRPVVDAVRHV